MSGSSGTVAPGGPWRHGPRLVRSGPMEDEGEDKDRVVPLKTRLPWRVIHWLKVEAAQRGVPVSEFLGTIIDEWKRFRIVYTNHEKPPKKETK